MIQITLKIAKNGARFIYADGKRVSYRKAEEIDMHNREESICNVLDSHFPTADTTTLKSTDFNPRANVGTFKLVAWILVSSSNLQLFPSAEIRFERGYKKADDAVKALEYLKEYFGRNFAGGAVLSGDLGDFTHYYQILYRRGGYITINKLDDNNAEPDPNLYAVNPDAFDIAVNAEIQNANTAKINDLKWEIRYTEGSINDLDKNHIAHFPQDQSLQERRVELVNELAALKAQLAEIEPANTHEADHITGIKMTNTTQAGFLKDKINRESKSIDDSTTDRDEVFNLLPDLDNDVEKVWLTKGELDDLTAKFRAAVSIIPVTTRIEKGLPVIITITKQNSAKPFDMGFGAFAKYSIVQWRTGLRIMRNFSTLGIYDTPAQVEKVIDLLKAAITRGDKAFTFPTVDELIDPPELPTAKPRTLRDSINRAIKQCIRNRIGYLKSHNSKMEKYEYELLCLLQGARRELKIA